MDKETDVALTFFVNGKKIVEKCPDPEWTLLFYLRNKLRLTGTKLGCAEGGCGACTVMLSKYDRQFNKIMHFSVNACLAPLCSVHGMAVTTVEGIGSTKTRLHPVQERIAKSFGSQCGFCTPGIVMSMYTLMRNNAQPSAQDMESAFEGNLCRCTGYRPILDGFRTLTKEFQCGMGEQCCRNQNGSASDEAGVRNTLEEGDASSLYDRSDLLPYDPSQEPVFPADLQLSDKLDVKSLEFSSERVRWFRPVSLGELLSLKEKYPDARLVVGNTEVGIEMKFKNMHYRVLIAPTHVSELLQVAHLETGVLIGASVTLATLEEVLRVAIETRPCHQTGVLREVVEMLRWFAGHQVRNVAAVGGNIMTASPISDLNPIFLSAGCVLTVASKERGERKIVMDHEFFQGYRKTAVQSDEVMISILIPYTKENEYFCAYKQAHRRDDDIAIVNAAMRVEFEAGSNTVKQLALSFGGMAPVTVMARRTMQQLVGSKWDSSLVERACSLLEEDLPLPPGTPGGMEPYRRTLTTSFFFKFYLHVTNTLREKGIEGLSEVSKEQRSATALYQREASKGVQVFQESPSGQLKADSVGRPVAHLSAQKQATGEAQYCDDMPVSDGELYLGFVLSTVAHGKILSVDWTEALKMPGVVDKVDHNDITGSNLTGHVNKDEEVFVTKLVTCPGQIIGGILAHSATEAQRAAKAVKIDYEVLPAIISIEQAIAAESFIPPKRTLRQGDVDSAFTAAAHTLEGEVRVGGQEHFYLETQACVCKPTGEDGEMEVFSSTQSPSKTQMLVAEALGVQANKIVCRVKRMGGGFGGKETRSTLVAVPVAVAAHKMNTTVRCMLDRDEDMVLSGTRHPFLSRYKVGFTEEGKIIALDIKLYNNAGNSLDLSYSVMERAMFHIDNCYHIPNVLVTGCLCKTHTPSNTAFRGFGGPQGMFMVESLITDIAERLGVCPEQVRERNLYLEGDKTHYNQRLSNMTVRRCWDQVLTQSRCEERRGEVEAFNRKNRWKKRGLAVIPTKFGISFTAKFLNQAGALVHVYTDGSVLLSHAGTEMGQGLHTKMIQVASRVLRVPVEKIHISETSTATVPNMSPTAASASSDLNGMAVMRACQTIMERLEKFMAANPKGNWEDWVSAAYFDRVSLSSTGFYGTPDIGYDWEKNSGDPFSYFTMGAAVSEVEIDCLTGDHTVLRTDIVMDVGSSLNPAIDIGQIEGGFVQGYGLFTLEEQRYSPSGYLYTRGPGMYKIPGFTDIPVEFNVSLLKGAANPRAVYSSKAIGEPPLFLASSVFFAIKEAIKSARRDAGHSTDFTLHSPATAERIRMGCEDQFTKQFPEAEPGTYKPWIVYL